MEPVYDEEDDVRSFPLSTRLVFTMAAGSFLGTTFGYLTAYLILALTGR